MAQLVVRDLTRRFDSGGGISNISLTVEKGQFLVLLGPSGCGKSTLLRLIAGLEVPDSGEIEIDGVNRLQKGSHRDAVAMVFQNLALYPHMTAFQNIAFPLQLRRTPHDEMERRVRESASKAGLALDLNRFPRELSGGERQRVALARALVREPQIVLMDEALASLDAQLRLSLRSELKEFQRRTGRTFVYVTHDQAEALALADILAVMRAGTIEQIGRPEDVFTKPATEFVARFLGSPPMNLFPATVEAGGVRIADAHIPALIAKNSLDPVLVGIRPDDFRLEGGAESIGIEVVVEAIEYSGTGFLLHARWGESSVTAIVPKRFETGSQLKLHVSRHCLHFFDVTNGTRLSI
ncbi:MAG: ABC transporter ATP-binding protein [Candidatus Binatus sp.]|uniref:ABC transporter ATP-binding protein n=1 Tax=Candidatus Binatus sp. TaxID=2811406 RepID=UPI002718EFF2|nr:ABC transporter ATP-binding protein [Candidatus Binatus sp.]MDO8434029.1 ABC transporter ATP-binding protein [Candidatus Binatus sp.]